MLPVTVVITCFNSERYIEEAISSILAQSFKDFELLIVNDGSTDKTLDKIEIFNDNRLRVINNDRNFGIAYSRNVAIQQARGRYMAVLDSDDICYSDRLEVQFNYLESHPLCLLCGGHGEIIDSSGRETGEILSGYEDAERQKVELLFHNFFVHSSVMFRLESARQLGGYRDFRHGEDYDLIFRISMRGEIYNMSRVMIKYRRHEGNSSVTEGENAMRDLKQIKLDQLTSLGIGVAEYGESFIHFVFNQYDNSDADVFKNLILEIKSKNKILPKAQLAEKLFLKWFEILSSKKNNVPWFRMYFDKNIFLLSAVKKRHLMKVFRYGLKNSFRYLFR